jgi:competence protein ComFC
MPHFRGATTHMNFLDFLFPKRCVGCGKIGKYFCDRCVSKVRIIQTNEAICPVCEKPAIDGATHPGCKTRYSIDGLTSFFRYDSVTKKAIKSIKYRFVSSLAEEFVSLIPDSSFSQITMNDERLTVFVPIPLHPSRLRERGFNQAEIFGKILAKRLHIVMNTNMLHRTKKTTPQVEMRDRKTRLKNMDGVFAISPNFDKSQLELRNVKNSKLQIVLFDDVFTTGATMRAAASILRHHGVQSVWGVTIAR